MTEVALIAVGVIAEALGFSLGILVGIQVSKERKNDNDKRKETQRQIDQRDPAWWHRTDIERRRSEGGAGDGWKGN